MSTTDIPFVNLSRVVRRGWLVILIVTLLFGALGALGWLVYPSKYDATATLEVTTGSDSTTPNMQTEETIAQSTGVLVLALEDLSGFSLAELRSAVSVTVPHDADVLEISVKDSSARTAAKAANAVAKAYLGDRRNETSSRQAQSLDQLETQIADVEKDIADASSSTTRRATLEARLSALNSRYADARADVGEPGRILSNADAPNSPSTPGLPLWLAAGIVAGLLIGFYAASVRERIRRVRGE